MFSRLVSYIEVSVSLDVLCILFRTTDAVSRRLLSDQGEGMLNKHLASAE